MGAKQFCRRTRGGPALVEQLSCVSPFCRQRFDLSTRSDAFPVKGASPTSDWHDGTPRFIVDRRSSAAPSFWAEQGADLMEQLDRTWLCFGSARGGEKVPRHTGGQLCRGISGLGPLLCRVCAQDWANAFLIRSPVPVPRLFPRCADRFTSHWAPACPRQRIGYGTPLAIP